MLYLLDANVLITAHNLYYPVNKVEEFWEWLQYQGAEGHVKMPIETFEEVKDGPNAGKDLLYAWVQQKAVKDALILHEEVDLGLVQKVTGEGYGTGLTDTEVEAIGRDPFLIAHALTAAGRMVISTEVSKPKRQRSKRKVPDVCSQFGIKCEDPFFLYRTLDFSTSWIPPARVA